MSFRSDANEKRELTGVRAKEFRKKNAYLKSREKCRLVAKAKDDKPRDRKFFLAKIGRYAVHPEEQKLGLLTTRAHYVLKALLKTWASLSEMRIRRHHTAAGDVSIIRTSFSFMLPAPVTAWEPEEAFVSRVPSQLPAEHR